MKKIYIFTIGVLLSVCLGSTQNFYAAAAAVAKENPFIKRKRELGVNLILAAKPLNLREIKRLINLKAPVDFVDKIGNTALLLVAQDGYAPVKTLLDAGANVNWQNDKGATALMKAASNPDVPINVIETLLNAGARVDLKDLEGSTALFYAIEMNNILAVELLVLAGANPNIQNNKGYSAWTLPIVPWFSSFSPIMAREQMNIIITNALAKRQQRAEHISSTLEREQNIPSPVARIIGEYEGSEVSRASRAVPTEAGEGEVEEKEGADIQKQKEQKNLENID